MSIPTIGFGTFLIKNNDSKSIVYEAIKAGYRHIDTAEAYENEEGVGEGIKQAIDEKIITREDIYVTTKVFPGNPQWNMPGKTYDDVISSFNKSLSKLNLDYIDLYLIHAAFPKDERLDQWKALLDLKKDGKTKSIGVCNYNIHHINEIKEANLALPENNQIELHPWSQKPELVQYLKDNKISITAYSSLIPLSNWRNDSAKYVEGKPEHWKEEGKADDSPFKIMANKYSVSEAQILLKWAIQKGYKVLPKSVDEKRIKENFDLFSFEIDEADMNHVESMDKGAGIAWPAGDPCLCP